MDHISSKLLVAFELRSNLRNDYSLGLYLTDEKGECIISRNDILKTISEYQTEYPMDYSSDLTDCTAIVVAIESKKKLRKRANRLREFFPEEAKFLKLQIDKCSNPAHSFEFIREFPLPISLREFICIF